MTLEIEIRKEQTADIDGIRALTHAAFEPMPFSDNTEPQVIDALRTAGELSLSLVAVKGNSLLGQVCFSRVSINGETLGWYGLGPVAVWPEFQGQGIGGALIRAGLEHLKQVKARGCALIGDPGYYERFGFISDAQVTYRDVESKYVQYLLFEGPAPQGELVFSDCFDAPKPGA